MPLISELLPAYYAAHGTDPAYRTIRSIMIDGHDVAWMEYAGTVSHDITGQEREGQRYTGRGLYCACHFTKGVGWEHDPKLGIVGLVEADRCVYRKTAKYLRHLELRKEYLDRFAPGSMDSYSLHDHTREIFLDLIEKVKTGEFIGESGNGIAFWGGYYYLGTAAAITEQSYAHLWKVIHSLMEEKIIGMNGLIITPYREPVEAAREEKALTNDAPD